MSRKVPVSLDYETAKSLALHMDAHVRAELARHKDTPPEILVFLTADPADAVREEVAYSTRCPHAADMVLARDQKVTVRKRLLDKVLIHMPRTGKLESLTAELLMVFAEDGDPAVRQALSLAVKALESTPRPVANSLARDQEWAVAEPVLRHSPVLTDDDLIEISRASPHSGTIGTIARRSHVSPVVADAIARSDNVDAVTVLLANKSAQIREDTLDHILDRAPEHQAWHRPLVDRPSLSANAVKRLAGFVAQSLVEVLRQRPDLAAETGAVLEDIAGQRFCDAVAADTNRDRATETAWQDPESDGSAAAASPTSAKKTGKKGAHAAAVSEVKALAQSGALDESALSQAILDGNRGVVTAGLALLAGLPHDLVDSIVRAQSARGLTAIVWKAGLSMTFAVKVQLNLARLSPAAILYDKDEGKFPMSEDEMREQLNYFSTDQGGGKAA